MPNDTVHSVGYVPQDIAVTVGTQRTWTLFPAAVTEFLGLTQDRFSYTCTFLSDFRIIVEVSNAASAGAKLRLEYSTNGGAAWANAQSSGTTGDVAADAVARVTGTWVALATLAKADVLFRIVGHTGDGIDGAVFDNLHVQFR